MHYNELKKEGKDVPPPSSARSHASASSRPHAAAPPHAVKTTSPPPRISAEHMMEQFVSHLIAPETASMPDFEDL